TPLISCAPFDFLISLTPLISPFSVTGQAVLAMNNAFSFQRLTPVSSSSFLFFPFLLDSGKPRTSDYGQIENDIQHRDPKTFRDHVTRNDKSRDPTQHNSTEPSKNGTDHCTSHQPKKHGNHLR
ncbi:MAG: hypothetical protein KDB11_28130, partial [Planctomycetales bacterium]|nr:hypothetical protein [Planctomycetales bacterium]